MFILILLCLAFAIGVPALVAWLVIKYVFELRKRQNDEFLKDLGIVVHNAVRDAINDTKNKND